MKLIIEWQHIPGYGEYYSVSNTGLVRSNARVITTRKINQPTITVNECILKPRINKYGYIDVCLSFNNKKITALVHRLIAIAFIPNPDNKPCVNHIDSDRTNNAVSNLEWVTSKENIQHALKNGRVGRLSISQDKLNQIEELLKAGVLRSEIRKQLNVSIPSIRKHFP